MTAIYSYQFFAGELPANGTTIYTPPAGATVVVRDCQFYNGSGAAGLCSITVRSPASFLGPIANAGDMAASAFASWNGRVVLAPGQVIASGAGATGFYVVVSGYLFDS